jgi:hypothetical protein
MIEGSEMARWRGRQQEHWLKKKIIEPVYPMFPKQFKFHLKLS